MLIRIVEIPTEIFTFLTECVKFLKKYVHLG